MADVSTGTPQPAALDRELREARQAEAAHYEARLSFYQARMLRLAALLDDLAPVFAATPAGLASPELTTNLAAEPRLWIDLVTSVVMEPDPKTYRLIRDAEAGREVLCETAERPDLAAAVRRHLAHRQVAMSRQTPSAAPIAPVEASRRLWFTVAAAFASGAAAAVVLDMLLK